MTQPEILNDETVKKIIKENLLNLTQIEPHQLKLLMKCHLYIFGQNFCGGCTSAVRSAYSRVIDWYNKNC